jgi:hypothetical protein
MQVKLDSDRMVPIGEARISILRGHLKAHFDRCPMVLLNLVTGKTMGYQFPLSDGVWMGLADVVGSSMHARRGSTLTFPAPRCSIYPLKTIGQSSPGAGRDHSRGLHLPMARSGYDDRTDWYQDGWTGAKGTGERCQVLSPWAALY